MDIPFEMDDEGLSPTSTEPVLPSTHLRVLDYDSPSAAIPKYLKQADDTVTTTEDELRFEEDADDKLDRALQKQLEHEYEVARLHGTLSRTLTPPENFAPVIKTIYRLLFPQPSNFEFIKSLKLKLVLCLIPEEYPEAQLGFLAENDIKLFQLGMLGNKEPFVIISADLITEAAKIVLNPANHPILIHCNRGKHRTGCLVGVIRRLQQWSLSLIFDEYRKFAAPKERLMDQQFIELYSDAALQEYCESQGWLPLSWD